MLSLTSPRHISTLPFPVRRATALQASPARNRVSGHGHPRSGLGEPPDLDRANAAYRPRPSAKPDRRPASARHAPSGNSASAKRQARQEPRQPRVECPVHRQASERARHAHHSPSPAPAVRHPVHFPRRRASRPQLCGRGMALAASLAGWRSTCPRASGREPRRFGVILSSQTPVNAGFVSNYQAGANSQA